MAKQAKNQIPASTRVLRSHTKRSESPKKSCQRARNTVSFNKNVTKRTSNKVKLLAAGVPLTTESAELPKQIQAAKRIFRSKSLHQKKSIVPEPRMARSQSIDGVGASIPTENANDMANKLVSINCKLSNSLISMNMKYMEAVELINSLRAQNYKLAKELDDIKNANSRRSVAAWPLKDITHHINRSSNRLPSMNRLPLVSQERNNGYFSLASAGLKTGNYNSPFSAIKENVPVHIQIIFSILFHGSSH